MARTFFLLSIVFPFANAQEDGDFFNGCIMDTYYKDLLGSGLSATSWDPLALATLLRDTHKQALPYTSSSREDVWDALIDLDSNQGVIQLIYSATDMTASDYGTPDTWNREHLWPQSRGVGSSGPDHTDIHHLRPSDWNINAARSNLFFGDCEETCTSRPAHEEAAVDTARNTDMFLPPSDVRGDIARALFYMALRYSFNDQDDTEVLVLTDCPDDESLSQMGYLSDLLRWHEQDPPDDAERIRNDRVCSRWQGNRNVFVDFPELVSYIYGEPSEKPYGCNSENLNVPTLSPTTSSGDTAVPTAATTAIGTILSTVVPSLTSGCEQLSPGDVQVVSVSADNPDAIMLIALEDLPIGLEIYLTDNAWTGSDFRVNEGTVMLRLTERLPKGTIFGYGVESIIPFGDSWESAQVGNGVFALATAGDSVLIYCVDDGRVRHLGGIISGVWASFGDEVDSTDESQKPDSLATIGAVDIEGGWDNLLYIGPITGTKAVILEALSDSTNWKGSNSERFLFSRGDFDILEDDSRNQGTMSNKQGEVPLELTVESSSAFHLTPVGRSFGLVLLIFLMPLQLFE